MTVDESLEVRAVRNFRIAALLRFHPGDQVTPRYPPQWTGRAPHIRGGKIPLVDCAANV